MEDRFFCAPSSEKRARKTFAKVPITHPPTLLAPFSLPSSFGSSIRHIFYSHRFPISEQAESVTAEGGREGTKCLSRKTMRRHWRPQSVGNVLAGDLAASDFITWFSNNIPSRYKNPLLKITLPSLRVDRAVERFRFETARKVSIDAAANDPLSSSLWFQVCACANVPTRSFRQK